MLVIGACGSEGEGRDNTIIFVHYKDVPGGSKALELLRFSLDPTRLVATDLYRKVTCYTSSVKKSRGEAGKFCLCDSVDELNLPRI